MNSPTNPTRRDYLKSILYISIYVIVIGGSAFLLLPEYWLAWGLVVLVGLGLLVYWHKSATVYRCPNCDHVYTVSFLQDLIAPHGLDKGGAWLLLKCPSCKERHKTRVLKKGGEN
jgi:hypothetical protein